MFVAFPYLKELNRQRYLVQLSLQMRTHTYGHILECETQELVVTGDSRSMSTRHLVINVAEVYWREKEKGASPCFLLQGVCVCVQNQTRNKEAIGGTRHCKWSQSLRTAESGECKVLFP